MHYYHFRYLWRVYKDPHMWRYLFPTFHYWKGVSPCPNGVRGRFSPPWFSIWYKGFGIVWDIWD